MPVLLSVGYSACHWCHVMAHESFEDDATAAYLNEHYVSVKVDREERPDVDAIYMQATTAMTGHGGWPMTVVLDHDGNPFFAGTYFPDRARGGMPAFRQVLEAVARGLDRPARRRTPGGRGPARPPAAADGVRGTSAPIDAAVLDAAVARLWTERRRPARRLRWCARSSRRRWCSRQLLRHARRTGVPAARAMVDATCEAMARGGMYDQLGGGFARYAVDRAWVVPHFEKMLYDNALLLGVYARWGTPLGERVAAETADFLVRELGTAEGGLAAALDADSEGEEGRFYVWTPAQLTDALGEDDGAWAADAFEVTASGTFEHGASTLQLLAEPTDSERLGRRPRAAARRASGRVRPARDDKVVAAWNGLAIVSLVDAGRLLGREDLVDAAVRAGTLLAELHLREDGSLLRGLPRRSWPAGTAACWRTTAAWRTASWRSPARRATWPGSTGRGSSSTTRWRSSAPRTAASTTRSADAEALVARPRDPSDGASPSGTLGHRARAGGRRRDDRRGPLPRGGRGGARHRRRARGAGAAVRRLVAGGRRGDGGRPARGRGGRPGRVRRATSWSGPRVAPRASPSWWPTRADGGIPLLDARGPVGGDAGGVRVSRDGVRAAGDDRRRPDRAAGGRRVALRVHPELGRAGGR